MNKTLRMALWASPLTLMFLAGCQPDIIYAAKKVCEPQGVAEVGADGHVKCNAPKTSQEAQQSPATPKN